METKKIAVACFIGGALCCAVALIFAPAYWWFGLIAGMAGGYISYEFREVRKAIPIALRAAGRGSVYALDGLITSAKAWLKAWLSRPHPFFYPGAVFAFPLTLWASPYLLAEVVKGHSMAATVALSVISLLNLYGGVVMILSGSYFFLALLGARVGKRCYWYPFEIEDKDQRKANVQRLRDEGYREQPLTYLNVLRWAVIGIAITIRLFAWTLWKYLAIGAFYFAWHLFKLIHSEKRVLCAIDGTLGGAVNYIWFASASMSFPEQVMFVVFGGLLGAAFGVANWEIVSKRILHVAPVSNT